MASQGKPEDDAPANLREELELHFERPVYGNRRRPRDASGYAPADTSVVGNRVLQTIDLHGQTWSEGLTAFIEVYNDTLRQTGDEVDVVHGYGSTGVGGALRTRLRAFLQRHEAHLEFRPGEEVDGNQGHTVVVSKTPLPGIDDMLAELVWDYCQRSKARGKIMGRFRRHGQPKIKQAIRDLERQRRLRTVRKGRVTAYEAVGACDRSVQA